jgi:hypothetical protein
MLQTVELGHFVILSSIFMGNIGGQGIAEICLKSELERF